MPAFERSIEIAASPETVWKIAADQSLVPKIFPDTISVNADPPDWRRSGRRSP